MVWRQYVDNEKIERKGRRERERERERGSPQNTGS
jgi:hypothetical protein